MMLAGRGGGGLAPCYIAGKFRTGVCVDFIFRGTCFCLER